MSEGIPARIRVVDDRGYMTPEFFRALQAIARSTGSQPVGSMYMSGNATATTGTASPVKVAGATTAGELYAFDHTTGRLTYTGALAKVMTATVCATFTSTSGNTVGIGVSVNGTTTMQYLTAGSGSGYITAQVVAELQPGDYIEAVTSNSAGNAVTVTDLQVTAR